MYTGIKIVITIFIVFSGLLNAMQGDGHDSTVSSYSLNVVGNSKPMRVLSEESLSYGNSNNSFDGQSNTAAGVGSDSLGNLVENLSTNKESEEDDSLSPGLYIVTRPFVWSSKLTNKFLKSLEDRPIARTLFVCSMQTTADIVAMHPEATLSVCKTGISKSGNVAKLVIGSVGAFMLINYQTGLFSAGVSALFGSGNLMATWLVGGKVTAVGKRVEEVIKKLDNLVLETKQLDKNINQLNSDEEARYSAIIQELEIEREKLESLKNELTSLVDTRADQIQSKIDGVLTRIENIERNFDAMQKKQDTLIKGQERIESNITGISSTMQDLKAGLEETKELSIRIETEQRDNAKLSRHFAERQKNTSAILDKMKEEIIQFRQEFTKYSQESKKSSDQQIKIFTKLEDEIKNLKTMNEEEIVTLWSKLKQNFVEEITKKIEGITDDVVKTLQESDAAVLIEFQKSVQKQIDKRFDEFRSEMKNNQEELKQDLKNDMNELKNELTKNDSQKDKAHKLSIEWLQKEIADLKLANEQARKENKEMMSLLRKMQEDQASQGQSLGSDLAFVRDTMEALIKMAQTNHSHLRTLPTSSSRIALTGKNDDSSEEEEKEFDKKD